MRIVFIEPESPDFHIFSRFILPRLGTLILGSQLKRAGHEVEVMVESVQKVDYKKLLSADLIGISAITSTAKRSYVLADELVKQGKTVIFGGPHPSFFPEESLAHGHFVLRGEAEESILPFISAVEQKAGLEKIPGLSFKVGDRVFHNPSGEPCFDLDTLPFPDFRLLSSGLTNIKPMITSRGCPYDCSFCAVTQLFGRKYRFRTPENVLEELVQLNLKKGDTLFFYDDNFVANPEHTKKLLRLMIENKITPQWTAQVRVDCAKDEELLELMKQSGAFFVYLGLESVNPETLRSYRKKLSVEQIEAGIAQLHQYGIRSHGMFVLGADTDTVETIRQTANFALKNKIDTVQFLILTPIPGTKLYREIESGGRLLTQDWSLYDGHHVVHQPAKMTAYQLQVETIRAMAKFYSAWRLIWLFLRFDFLTFIYRSYGNQLVARWRRQRGTRKYFQMMKEVSAGTVAKLGDNYRKTAEDIKHYFERLRRKNVTHS